MSYLNGNSLTRKSVPKTPPAASQNGPFDSPWLKMDDGIGPVGDEMTSRNLESLQSVSAAYSASQSYLPETFSNIVHSSSPSHRSRSATLTSAKYRSNSASSPAQTDLYGGTLDSRDYYRRRGRVVNGVGAGPDRYSTERELSLLERYAARGGSVEQLNPVNSRARSMERSDYPVKPSLVYGTGAKLSRHETMPMTGAAAYVTLPRQHGRSGGGGGGAGGGGAPRYLSDDIMSQSMTSNNPQSKDMLILDLQTRIAQLNSDCATLNSELDSTREKLDSNMNSIRTFWSPELKKERAVRKEESCKHHAYRDQIAAQQALLISKHQSEMQLQKEEFSDYEINNIGGSSIGPSFLRRSLSSNSGSSNSGVGGASGGGIIDRTENNMLRKTITEMEVRIGTQKETLSNRDESIKRLLNIMQSKGSPYESDQYTMDQIDNELLRTRIVEDQQQMKHLQSLVDKQHLDIDALQKGNTDPKVNNATKDKVDQLENKLSTSETKIILLQTQNENYERQCSDDKHRITLIKEQLTARDCHSTLQISELEKMKCRLQEKEQTLLKKSTRVLDAESSLKQAHLEIIDLQTTFGAMELTFSDKLKTSDVTLASLNDKLTHSEKSLSLFSSRETKTIESHQDTQRLLVEKTLIIDRLKEELNKSDVSHYEKIQFLEKNCFELQKNEHQMQTIHDISKMNTSKLSEDIDLLKSESDLKNKRIIELEVSFQHNLSNLQLLQDSNEQLKSQLSERATFHHDKSSEVTLLQERVAKYEHDAQQHCATEKRLTNQIAAIERINIQEVQSLRKQLEDLEGEDLRRKVKHEADKKQDFEDTGQMKRVIIQYTNRVEELEEALKKSVAITAQREMHMQGLQSTIDQQHKQITSSHEDLIMYKDDKERRNEQFVALETILSERDSSLERLQVERILQLKELYEMKQEAIVAAISEKDAHIALLENQPNCNQKNIDNVTRLTGEKLQLQKQLGEVTQKRITLHLDDKINDSKIPISMKKSPRKNKKSN